MVQFGPNTSKSHCFCIRVIIFLVFIATLAFGASLIALYFLNKGYKLAIHENSRFINSNSDVFIETKLGTIKGFSQNVFNIKVNTFLGIPYAQPPIFERRFEKPLPVKPWINVLNTVNYAPHCAQNFEEKYLEIVKPLSQNISEDCLYLNIWSPDHYLLSHEKQLKPVMVWFHGGGFSEGSANLRMSEGSILAALGDLVVVTFNYRLGFFGFLDTGPDHTTNQALYDQKLALEWVKENIESLGGDPNAVTLFGQSAGAICIGIHMISPLTKNLFKRAILQSGSPILFKSFYNDNTNSLHSLAEMTSCNQSLVAMSANKTSIDEEILQCLKYLSTEEILKASKLIVQRTRYPFNPVPFDEIMPALPSDIINEQIMVEEYSSIQEILLGGNEDEFSFYLHLTLPNLFSREEIKLNLSTLEELKSLFINFTHAFGIEKRIASNMANYFFYDGPEVDTKENLVKRFYTVFGDLMFTCPSLSFAQELAKINKTVYFYWFKYRPGYDLWGSWAGTPHMSEIPYVFGIPLIYSNIFTTDDMEMSKKIIKIWSYFAKYGNVLPQNNVQWPKFLPHNEAYMELNLNEAKVDHNLHKTICAFFRIAFDSLR